MSASMTPAAGRHAVPRDLSWLAPVVAGLHGVPNLSAAEFPYELRAAAGALAAVTTPANPIPTGLASSLFDGATPARFRRTLPDILPEIPMTGGLLQVPNLSVGTLGGPHAEGAAKVEAAMTFTGRANPAQSIATWVGLNDELLDDTPGLDAWLRLFLPFLVKRSEERELIQSNGVTSKIVGLLTPGLLPTYSGAVGTISAIVNGMIAQAVMASGIMPDTIVISGTDWAALMALAAASPQLDMNARTYAGIDGIVSPWLATGQVIVGPLQALAVLGREGPILVEGTQSHDTNFIANKSAIRAQSRIALGILMTQAFVAKLA